MSLELLMQAQVFRDNYPSKVASAVSFIKDRLRSHTQYGSSNHTPVFGVVLGSGLGDLADSVEQPIAIPYNEIPNFPQTTVSGHEGTLLIGALEGVPVILLKGRKHYYETADAPFNNGILHVVFPVHVLAGLGVHNYFVTNAAGGLNQRYAVGDIMIIRSHINNLPNPLWGRHYDFLRVDNNQMTSRFQPMNGAYDPGLIKLLRQAGSAHSEQVHEGVYLAVSGPTYETEAESVAFRDGSKADAVGMSTTPEVIVARNRGMNAVGFSCITNVIASDGTNATNHEEVKRVLESPIVRDRLSSTVREFFRLYRERG